MVDVHSAFQAKMVGHLHTAAEGIGYDLLLGTQNRTRDEGTAIETLLAFRCEALILLGPVAPALVLAELDRKAPIVSVGPRITGVELGVVRSADDDGVGQIVDHLVCLGHREIAYVCGGKDVIAADRRRGCRNGVCRHGLDWLIRILHGAEESGDRAGRYLADGDLSTAVVTFNERSAVGLLTSLWRAGADVPGAVSVAGCGDDALSRLSCFDLTTVRQAPRSRPVRPSPSNALIGIASPSREIALALSLVLRGDTSPPR